MTLSIGVEAPLFNLPADNGEIISLSQYRGQRVILFFYPKDYTPGCTQEVCDFRDHSEWFRDRHIVLLGISKDKVTTHAKFKAKYSLPFILLTDEEARICEAYGVINKKSLFGKTFLGIQRSTFLIDEKGIIAAMWRKVSAKNHVEQIIHAIG